MRFILSASMSTRREFLKQTAIAGALVATSNEIARATEDVVAKAIAPTKVGISEHNAAGRVKSVIRREETVLRYGGNGDNWHMSWASDDRQYVSLCDGAGFTRQPTASYNSRMLAISGGPHDAQFHDLHGYPMLGAPTQKPRDAR
jgi:hypothetical protein